MLQKIVPSWTLRHIPTLIGAAYHPFREKPLQKSSPRKPQCWRLVASVETMHDTVRVISASWELAWMWLLRHQCENQIFCWRLRWYMGMGLQWQNEESMSVFPLKSITHDRCVPGVYCRALVYINVRLYWPCFYHHVTAQLPSDVNPLSGSLFCASRPR